jgi:hypothetical protein
MRRRKPQADKSSSTPSKGAKPTTKKKDPEYPWAQPTPPVDKLPDGFLPSTNPMQGRPY